MIRKKIESYRHEYRRTCRYRFKTTWILLFVCVVGGELPLGNCFARSSFWNPESFTEQSEIGVFLAKSRSDVITLQSYRPRSQLQKASVYHKINYFTWRWDLGLLFRNVLATAMREVRTCCIWEFVKKSGRRYSRYSKTLLRYPQINLSYWKLVFGHVFGHVFEVPHVENMQVKSDLIQLLPA